MAAQSGKQDDQVYVAILILFFVITVLAILGPIGVAVALLTVIIGIIAGLGHAGGVAVALGGAGLGTLLICPQEWLAGPAREMTEIYRIYLFDGSRWDMDGLGVCYIEMLAYWPSWKYFTPLGIFAGGATLTVCRFRRSRTVIPIVKPDTVPI